MRRNLICLALACLCLAAAPSLAAAGERAEVSAELAVTSVPPGGRAIVKITLAPSKGIKLYRDKTQVEITGPGRARLGKFSLPGGESSYDPGIEKTIESYKKPVSFEVPVLVPEDRPEGSLAFKLKVHFQGCGEELCYPPEFREFDFKLQVAGEPVSAEPGEEPGPPPPATSAPEASQGSWIERGIAKGGLLTILFAFLGGLGVAFTPCIYPMVPVTVALIGGAAASGDRKPGKLTLVLYTMVYVLGISITYTVLGVIAASAGSAMGQIMDHPVTVAIVGLVMGALSLSMFGAFDLTLPSGIVGKLGRFQGAGSLPMLLVSGLVMGLVASPCVSAPLTALFVTLGRTGNLLLGGVSLFAFGWGMSALLIVAGIFPGLLGRPGAWMNTVKDIFALILAAFGLYFVRNQMPAALFGWTGLAVAAVLGALLLLAAQKLPEGNRRRQLVKGLGGISLVVAAYLAFGFGYRTGALAHLLPQSALPVEKTSLHWRDYTPELMAGAAGSGRPVLLYFKSDGCYACGQLKRRTFPDPRIVEEARRFELLNVNISRANPHFDAIVKKHGVIGVPVIALYGPDGTPRGQSAGFLTADALLAKLRAVR